VSYKICLLPKKKIDTLESSSSTPLPFEPISLENPTATNPSFLLMATDSNATSISPHFTHNFQIKQSLAMLIIDNGSQNNLVAQDLVN
jgi:hypothetical protein